MVSRSHCWETLGKTPIHFQGVGKMIGGNEILKGISFTIPQGVICSMVGPNGAGKTTTIRLMLGLLKPSSGAVKVWGQDPQNKKYHMSRVGVVLDNDLLWEKYKGVENIKKCARLWGLSKGDYAEEANRLMKTLDIEEALSKPVYTYSKGMKRKLTILIALMNNPVLLICDELTTGIDPKPQHDIRSLLFGMRKEGKTIFYTSHNLEEVQRLSDTVLLIEKGRLCSVVDREDFKDVSLESLYLKMVDKQNGKK